MVEVASACVGLRVSSGSAGACEGGDMDIVVEDVGSARYALKSISGIADLGIVDPAVADSSGAHFGQNVVPIAGHTYAVQLSGGKVAVFKISAILSPSQLAAIANKRFNRAGRGVVRGMGGDTGTTDVGDTSGKSSSNAIVYFDLMMKTGM